MEDAPRPAVTGRTLFGCKIDASPGAMGSTLAVETLPFVRGQQSATKCNAAKNCYHTCASGYGSYCEYAIGRVAVVVKAMPAPPRAEHVLTIMTSPTGSGDPMPVLGRNPARVAKWCRMRCDRLDLSPPDPGRSPSPPSHPLLSFLPIPAQFARPDQRSRDQTPDRA